MLHYRLVSSLIVPKTLFGFTTTLEILKMKLLYCLPQIKAIQTYIYINIYIYIYIYILGASNLEIANSTGSKGVGFSLFLLEDEGRSIILNVICFWSFLKNFQQTMDTV
jgi:hypothetical protein